MSATSAGRVSHRGQTTIPAEWRHRHGLADGGDLGFIDLGDLLLVVPGGLDVARREVLRIAREHYEEGLAMIDDPDLADQ